MPMSDPELELYSVVKAEDELGTGIDIYTSGDDIYQIRFGDDAITSLYREDGAWAATVRHPVDGNEDGYDRFHALAERFDDAYDTAMERSVMAFHNELTERNAVVVEGGDTTLSYRPDSAVDFPEAPTPYSRTQRALKKAGKAVSGAGNLGVAGGLVGGLAGGLGGALLGDPALGAMIGSGALGGTGGALGGWAGHGMGSHAVAEGTTDTLTPRGAYNRLTGAEEEPAQNRVVGLLFDRLNERNRLEVHLEEVPQYDEALIDRYDALQKEELDRWQDTVLDLLFHDADRLAGVTAHYEAGSYTDIRDFVDTAFDEPVTPRAEPSLYADTEAFQQVMAEMTHEDGVFRDAHTIVDNLWTHPDAAEETTAWLEEEYPDLVQSVGRERTLEGA